ncbi:MAG: PLP-dependent aminotransferase family protein, partial [Acidobacteria bacterium]|nr:PLP-dependent aminotransferase family protein [Acidobacteriota bacterium]
LPPLHDAGELLARTRAEKVLFVPGRFFEVSHSHSGELRLSFAGLPPEKIRRGLAVLGRIIGAQTPLSSEVERGGAPALV